MTRRYDHPSTIVRREHFTPSVLAASATDHAPFRSFQKIKLIAAHFVVTVSHSATDCIWQIYDSATSVGSVTIGTAVIGTKFSITINNAVPSLAEITSRFTLGAIGTGDITYEYEVEHDATQTTQA